jgi:hypothetical protein
MRTSAPIQQRAKELRKNMTPAEGPHIPAAKSAAKPLLSHKWARRGAAQAEFM